jgi:hypothetical protein
VGIGTTSPTAALDVNGVVNASTSFDLGGNAFAFGSAANNNAFCGFAGNFDKGGWIVLYWLDSEGTEVRHKYRGVAK